jgi:hypothetical protein
MRRIRRGYGRYKGKLPLNFFNWGRIVHLSSKFPYGKEDSTKQEKYNNKKKIFYPRMNNFGKKKKILYINEESDASDEDDSSNKY